MKLNTQYEIHPLANIFPMMDESRFEDLVEDIRQNGLVDAIDTYEGKILDGRNRYKACVLAGVSPRCYEYTGDDPLGYVLSKNLHRRHMDESQRAMVGANIATLKLGDNQHQKEGAQICAPSSVAQAAEAVNVGVRSVTSAKKVKADGDDALQALVIAGELPVSVAEGFTKIVSDKIRQAEIIETQGAAGVKDIVAAERKAKQLARDLGNKSNKIASDVVATTPDGEDVCCSIQFAELAILQLQRIQDWHKRKLDAVKLVKAWIAEREALWTDGTQAPALEFDRQEQP